MRKILPFLVVGILVLGGLGAVAFNNSEEKNFEKSTVSFSKPVLTTEDEYVTVNVDETNSFLMEQGKPLLPSCTQTFTFPFKTKIKSVTCTVDNIQTQAVLNDIKPVPKPVIVGQTTATESKPINYGVEPYPSNWFTYDVKGGISNGKLSVVVDVEVNPVKYYPQEKIIEWAKDVNIVIEYEEPVEQLSSREQYQLLIIAPDEFSDELAPLITHKTGEGITTKFAGLNEVYGGTGVDNQEKIKYYIKDAIEEWGTSNVLLVGSNQKLPSRETHVKVDGDPVDMEIFVSDLYFADIYNATGAFCDWDFDGDGKFGEYNWETGCIKNCDKVDLMPDVYLGRLACRNAGEVTTSVNKIINYENDQAYLQNWFKNLVVIGGDSFPDDDDVDEGEYRNQKVINLMTDFTAEKLWVTNGKLTSWVPTGVQNIKDSINAGCGFVDFSGHGNPSTWATHPHLNFNMWVPTPWPPGGIYNTHAQQLTNGGMLPIVIIEACSTAKFASDDDCLNWAFMLNPDGGAIGSFGATGLGWGYIGDYVDKGGIGKMGLDTFRAYKTDDSLTLGEMWAKALDRFIDSTMDDVDFKCTEEWQIFGDPTLQIAPESGAPLKPAKPSGTTSGVPGTEYTYTTSTTDPENDKIYYMFDWGDGQTSGWIGPYNSGATAQSKHTWSSKKTYMVSVQAKDEHGKVSEWSDPLTVTMPRSRTINNVLHQLLTNFKNTNLILKYILEL